MMNAELQKLVLDVGWQVAVVVFGAIWTWFLTKYIPTYLRPFFDNIRVDKVFTNGVYAAIAAAKENGDITPDGTVLVDMHQKYTPTILTYVDNNADPPLIEWMGDRKAKARSYLERVLASADTAYQTTSIVTPTKITAVPKK